MQISAHQLPPAGELIGTPNETLNTFLRGKSAFGVPPLTPCVEKDCSSRDEAVIGVWRGKLNEEEKEMKRICVGDVNKERRNLRVNEVYVGRSCFGWSGSVLGNKWKIGVDGNREEVVLKFRKWLWEMIQCGDDDVMKELERMLKIEEEWGLVVVCWCGLDERCHGDVIMKCLEWMKKNRESEKSGSSLYLPAEPQEG